jgi:hypothetical protein
MYHGQLVDDFHELIADRLIDTASACLMPLPKIQYTQCIMLIQATDRQKQNQGY